MSACDTFNTDVVVCDEIFYFEHDEVDVPLGFDAPAGSVLDGVVTVTLSACDIDILESGEFIVNALFIVGKELALTTPDGTVFPLEFVERLLYTGTFRKCSAEVLGIWNLSPEQLRCYVVRTSGRDVITLDTDNNTFSEELTIELKVQIIGEIQEFLPLCSPRHSVDIAITTV
ncbi:MAG: hypothetical protein GX316_06780 [Firmicutes bacterium]|nr:hypothetical protein [Bacillota bacterium]